MGIFGGDREVRKVLENKEIHLIGLTCIHLASKYEDI